MLKENRQSSVFIDVLIITLFMSDFITNISNLYFDFKLYRLAGAVKLMFEVFMLITVFKNHRNIERLPLLLFFLLITAFAFSNFQFYTKEELSLNNFYENIYFLNRYLYIFIFIIFVKSLNVAENIYYQIVKRFKQILYINSILIITGLLLKIELFRSYPGTARFGYDGIFTKDGEAVYYYGFFICILYFEYISKKTKNSLLKLMAICLISILIGKKALLLFLFVLLVGHIAIWLKKAKQLLYATVPIILVLVFFRNKIMDTFFKLLPYWKSMYDKYGVFGALTSTRSNLAENFINYVISDWGVVNYLFGAGQYEMHKVEFEVVDLFLFFGTLGLLVYTILFKRYFYNAKLIVKNTLLSCILITSFFCGGLFISVMCMMFFFVVFKWLDIHETTLQEKTI